MSDEDAALFTSDSAGGPYDRKTVLEVPEELPQHWGGQPDLQPVQERQATEGGDGHGESQGGTQQ